MSRNQVRIPIAVDLLEKSKAPQTSLPQFSAILIKIIDLFYSDFDSFGLKLRFSHSPALLPDILREFGSHGRTVACVQPPSPFEQGVAVHRLFVGVRGGGGGGAWSLLPHQIHGQCACMYVHCAHQLDSGYKNECANTVQITFHVVLCLLCTY